MSDRRNEKARIETQRENCRIAVRKSGMDIPAVSFEWSEVSCRWLVVIPITASMKLNAIQVGLIVTVK